MNNREATLKKEDLAKAQLEFASELEDFDIQSLKNVTDLFTSVNRLNESLKILREVISGNPKGRFDMLRALFLHPKGMLRPAELAEVADMTRASTSHNLDVLERNKLVVRQIDKKNRRSVKVKLTKEGLDLMERTIPDYLKTIEKISKCIDLSLIKDASIIMERLNEKMESAIDKYSEIQQPE